MKIATAQTTQPQTLKAFDACYKDLCTQLEAQPDILLLFTSVTHDLEALAHALPKRAPTVPVHGGTSCLGTMNQEGFCSEQGTGMGLWGLSDPEGSYGVGMVPLGDNPQQSGALAIRRAIAQAQRTGESPAMIWLTAAPGCEEEILQGIANVVGAHVPVFGGSTADNSVEGHWRQYTAGTIDSQSVIVSVFYPSCSISFAFQSGYITTEHTWEVTRSQGRTLLELDGQPAAHVYNEATQGIIGHALEKGGNILGQSTLQPLGRYSPSQYNTPLYLLSHPAEVTTSGGLVLFSNIVQGERVTLMRGTKTRLIQRAAEVTEFAMALNSWAPTHIHGALIIYCAGRMLSVQNDMDSVAHKISRTLGTNNPFLGIFTFGEQGRFFDEGTNQHGNLMVSAAIFGDTL